MRRSPANWEAVKRFWTSCFAHSTGKLATICDDLCDEEAAAADAQHIVESTRSSRRWQPDPTLELDPQACMRSQSGCDSKQPQCSAG